MFDIIPASLNLKVTQLYPGQTDKVKQMLLEEAMRQQATIIQAAMAQIAEVKGLVLLTF